MHSPRRSRKALKWCAAAIFLLLLLSVTIPPAVLKFAEHKVFSAMTPDQRAEFQVWLTRPIELPPEALEVAPFSDETIEAVRAYYSEWDKLGTQNINAHFKDLVEPLSAWPPQAPSLKARQFFEPLRLENVRRRAAHPQPASLVRADHAP